MASNNKKSKNATDKAWSWTDTLKSKKIKEDNWREQFNPKKKSEEFNFKSKIQEEYRVNKFKKWQFQNFAEYTLWRKLNEIWDYLEEDFRLSRYAHLRNSDGLSKSEDNLLAEDVLIFDTSALDLYSTLKYDTSYDSDFEVDFSDN